MSKIIKHVGKDFSFTGTKTEDNVEWLKFSNRHSLDIGELSSVVRMLIFKVDELTDALNQERAKNQRMNDMSGMIDQV